MILTAFDKSVSSKGEPTAFKRPCCCNKWSSSVTGSGCSGFFGARVASRAASPPRARRSRRWRSKAAKPPLAIGTHLPAESSARKLLLVALPPPLQLRDSSRSCSRT